jgi:hypothetical protein
MELVAAILSALEGEGGISLAELIQAVNLGTIGPASVMVTQDALGFFSARRMEALVFQQIAERITAKLLQANPRMEAMVRNLGFLPMFQKPELQGQTDAVLVAAFVNAYLTDGESLRAQMQSLPTAQRALLQQAYNAVKTVMKGKEITEKDLAPIAEARLSMQNDGGLAMKRESEMIEAAAQDPSQRQMLEAAFFTRFGMELSDFRAMSKTSLGQKILQLPIVRGMLNADKLKKDPAGAIRQVGLSLAGTGISGLAIGLGILIGALPMAAAAGVILLGGAILAGGLVVLAQTNRIAWRMDPGASILGRKVKGPIQELYDNPNFKQAVEGLRVPGATWMISEENRTRAVNEALNFLLRTSQSMELSDKARLAQTREVLKVLKALGFEVAMEPAKKNLATGQLSFQLTPVVQPPLGLLSDRKFQRLQERLKELGVNISIPAQWQPHKAPKIKTSEGAA